MRKIRLITSAALVTPSLLWLMAGIAAAQGPAQYATAQLKNVAGQPVGTASFSQTSAGVRLQVQVNGLPAGPHGIHIHAVGTCEPHGDHAFMTAGGHFNPAGKKHGLRNPEGPHAGDLPNLEVGPGGAGQLAYTNPLVTLGPGVNSLLKADGTALVIHEKQDDERTDPTGNSGERIACGVITMAARLPSTGGVAIPASVALAGLLLLGIGWAIRRSQG